MKRFRRIGCLVVCSAVLTMACGGSENPATLTTPSVSLQRTRVELGGVLTVTYRFEVGPNAHLDKDYRVLVHFLDAGEELLWTEDHTPPVPTSQWSPGQKVEYTKTHFVPIYPYVGEAVMTVGLYDPASGDRLTLSGEDTGQKEYIVTRLHLLPQPKPVLIVFGDGWHPAEQDPDNAATKWQWSKKEATWSFRNPQRNATFSFRYTGEPSLFDTPQSVTLYLQDRVIDTFEVGSSDEAIRTIDFEAAQFGSDEMVQLRMSVDRTFVPARVNPGAGDTRELGIRVFDAMLLPDTESALIMFKDGWHPTERDPNNPANTWRWSKKDATWSFRNPRRDMTFYLHYSGEPSTFETPQTVTLSLRDQVVGTFTVASAGEAVGTFDIERSQFGADAMAELRLSVDRTLVPDRKEPGSGDLRELGLRVFRAVLEPQ